MSTQLNTREELFAVMEQIADEREAAKPIVEQLVARGADEIWDSEIPEGWRTAGFVMELTKAAFEIIEAYPQKSLSLEQLALAVATNIPPKKYPSPVQTYLEGWIWRSIGLSQREQNAYDAALDAYDSAQELFARENALFHDETAAKFGRALVLTIDRRQEDEALRIIEQIEPVFRSFGDNRRLQMAELMKGNIHMWRGELQAARARLETLLNGLQHSNDDHRDALHTLATAYHNLGMVCTDLGSFDDALNAFHHARAIFADLGMRMQVDHTDWGFAKVLLARGEFMQAIPRLQGLRNNFLTNHMPDDAGLIGLDLVEALIATNHDTEAHTLTEQVLVEFRNAKLSKQAITALAYLHDLLPTAQEPRRAVKRVRTYVEKLRSEPALLFVPLED